MRFNIVTFGCKVNQYESNMMKENMLHHNFLYEENLNKCDIIIINTCTVTNTADKKCLKEVRRIKREYPNKVLVVVGCSVQYQEYAYKGMDIDILMGNKNKSHIGDIIQNYLETKNRYEYIDKERNIGFEDMNINSFNHVRAFMKIEDGCDNFCSYCIIPYVRGTVRSKNFDTCIEEAKCLVKNGHREIVLTGIHTGRYEFNGHDLSDLINELSKITGLERIRISSIEVTELNDKFLVLLKDNKKICNHLHIPLQSGSEEILKRMNRKYNIDYFIDKINTIRSIRPDISISTDIIVGFPGETDEQFKECLENAKKINFSKIHVFPYSKREGTVAAGMPNQVPEDIKKKRVKALIELSNELEKDYYNKFKGKELDVLVEEIIGNRSIGHTSNYLKVEIPEILEKGQIYKRVI